MLAIGLRLSSTQCGIEDCEVVWHWCHGSFMACASICVVGDCALFGFSLLADGLYQFASMVFNVLCCFNKVCARSGVQEDVASDMAVCI